MLFLFNVLSSDVSVVLSEEGSSTEQRVFFSQDPSQRESTLTLQLDPSDTESVTVYILVCLSYIYIHTHIRSDIENCEGWLSPGGHNSGGRH